MCVLVINAYVFRKCLFDYCLCLTLHLFEPVYLTWTGLPDYGFIAVSSLLMVVFMVGDFQFGFQDVAFLPSQDSCCTIFLEKCGKDKTVTKFR